MTHTPIFKGIATALITPMHPDGSVDYEAFGRLIDWQIECKDESTIPGTPTPIPTKEIFNFFAVSEINSYAL